MSSEDARPEEHQLVEALADIEHMRWAHWQRYLHDACIEQADGSLTIPVDLVKRWERQIRLRYADLDDSEKESDREQVRRYLPLLLSAFKQTRS